MNYELSILELRQELAAGNGPAIIDVRSPSEFATGHIAGARNIPLPELEARRAELEGQRLVLVCERGMRAQTARSALAPCFPEAQVLRGGMHAWRRGDLPLIRITRTSWSLERQVRLIAGSMVLIGVVLALTAGGTWSLVAAIPGTGLVLAGLTGLCPLARFLGRMPWNQACPVSTSVREKEAGAD